MSQGKTDIPGVDDGEDMLVTDVSIFFDLKTTMTISISMYSVRYFDFVKKKSLNETNLERF